MGQLDARLFRKLHRASGESIRWWKAVPVPPGTPGISSEGRLLVEQEMDESARFLIAGTSQSRENRDCGTMPAGMLQLSAFPDWAYFSHLDRIALLATGRWMSAYTPKNFERGAGVEDALPFSP